MTLQRVGQQIGKTIFKRSLYDLVSGATIQVGKKTKKKAEAEKGKFDYHSSRFFALLFPAVYAVALAIFCLVYEIIPGPEFLVLVFLIYAAYNKRTWNFLKDWLPFITVFLSYEAMYGVADVLAKFNLHAGPRLLEQAMFGGSIPSLVLQQSLPITGLDYVGAFFYSLHFFAPTIFAFILWKQSPRDYWKYTVAFGILSYSALLTFLLYPVAPPWWQFNSLYNPSYTGPIVQRVLTSSVDANLGLPVYKTMFDFLSPNIFAAFPSMHSALPWLISLFALKLWKTKALPVLIFPIGVWFSAVFLGEHYFVDVLGGIAYATLAFVVVEKLLPCLSCRIGFLKKHMPKPENKPSP
jgi:membrane-associated phospholipid phosphatase